MKKSIQRKKFAKIYILTGRESDGHSVIVVNDLFYFFIYLFRDDGVM